MLYSGPINGKSPAFSLWPMKPRPAIAAVAPINPPIKPPPERGFGAAGFCVGVDGFSAVSFVFSAELLFWDVAPARPSVFSGCLEEAVADGFDSGDFGLGASALFAACVLAVLDEFPEAFTSLASRSMVAGFLVRVVDFRVLVGFELEFISLSLILYRFFCCIISTQYLT